MRTQEVDDQLQSKTLSLDVLISSPKYQIKTSCGDRFSPHVCPCRVNKTVCGCLCVDERERGIQSEVWVEQLVGCWLGDGFLHGLVSSTSVLLLLHQTDSALQHPHTEPWIDSGLHTGETGETRKASPWPVLPRPFSCWSRGRSLNYVPKKMGVRSTWSLVVRMTNIQSIESGGKKLDRWIFL